MPEIPKEHWIAMLNELPQLSFADFLKNNYSDEQLIELWQKLGGSFSKLKNASSAQKRMIGDARTIDHIVEIFAEKK